MNYEIGFNTSLWMSSIIAGLIFINFVFPFMYLVYRDYRLMTIYFPIVSGLSVFAILYPTINTLFQLGQILEMLNTSAEFSEFLMIRATSILIGIKMFLSSMKSQMSLLRLTTFRKIREKGDYVYDEHQTESILYSEWRNLSQVSIFIIAAIVIQFSIYSSQNESLLIGAINLVLFFIVDDWTIINDYSTKYEKEILKFHKLRINIANIILVIGSTVAMFIFIDWKIGLGLFLILVLSAYWRYFYLPEEVIKLLRLNNLTLKPKDRMGDFIILPNDKSKKDAV